MSLIRKSLLSAVAAMALSGGRFLLMSVLARRLPTLALGQFAYAQWLIDMAFLLCTFGVNGASSRYIAEYAHDPSRTSTFIRRWLPWAILLPVLAGVGVLAGARISHLALTRSEFILLGIWAVTNGWWVMQTASLYGHQRYDLVLKANLMFAAVTIAGVLMISSQRAPLAPLFATMILATLLAFGFGFQKNVTSISSAEKGGKEALPWASIRTYAINTWLTSLLGALVWSRGELPLVRMDLGDQAVARYSVSLVLYFGAMQGVMLWTSGIAPHLTAEWGRGNKTGAVILARKFSDIHLLVSGGTALVVACFGREFLGWCFGSTYRTSAPILGILVLGLIALSASIQNHLLQIDTDARFTRNTSIAGLVCLYLFAWLLIPRFGLAGAASSRYLTLWVMFLVSIAYAWKAWGRATFSLPNLLVSVTPVSAAYLLMLGGATIVVRLLMATLGLVWLGLLIRGEGGTPVVWEVLGRGLAYTRQWISNDRRDP